MVEEPEIEPVVRSVRERVPRKYPYDESQEVHSKTS